MYEYRCGSCEARFEQIRKYDDRLKPAPCPSCEAENGVLALSAPGRVGVGARGAGSAEPAAGGGCATGACGLW